MHLPDPRWQLPPEIAGPGWQALRLPALIEDSVATFYEEVAAQESMLQQRLRDMRDAFSLDIKAMSDTLEVG
jgi:hypothetical protein